MRKHFCNCISIKIFQFFLASFNQQNHNHIQLIVVNSTKRVLERITRFFITIDLAVKGVLDAIMIMQGDEKFIIHNMLSLKIYDLAKALKKYYKYNKSIIIKGLRDGEKLYEELATKSEMKNYSIKKNLLILFNSRKIEKGKIILNKKVQSLSSKNAELLNEVLIIKFLKKSKLV